MIFGFNMSWGFVSVGVVSPDLRMFLTVQTEFEAFMNVFIACFDQCEEVLEGEYFVWTFNQEFDILPQSRLSHPISSCCLVASNKSL